MDNNITNDNYQNNPKFSKIIRTTLYNFGKNRQNFYSPKDIKNRRYPNKLIEYQNQRNYQKDIFMSTPLTSTATNFYRNKLSYPALNDNKYLSKNTSNMSGSFKFSRNIKNINTNNPSYHHYTNTDYIKSKTKNFFDINNNSLIESLTFKKINIDNDYTDLLINKTETQYPMSTYFISPSSNATYNFSSFNKLTSTNNINDFQLNQTYIGNKRYDLNNSQEWNSKTQYNSFLPKKEKIYGRNNRSESKNNIILSKSNEFSNLSHLNNYHNHKNDNAKSLNSNSFYNRYEIKFKSHYNYNSTNANNRSELNNSTYKKDNHDNFKYDFGWFFKKENNSRNIQNVAVFINCIKKILDKKMLILKEKFFGEIKDKIIWYSSNYNNISDNLGSFAINHKTIRINKYNNYIIPFKKINKSIINVEKNNKKQVYIPKKYINPNINNISKKICSININNPKNVTLKIQNNANESNYSNTSTTNFKEYLTLEKMNNTNNTNNIKTHEKNLLSLDNILNDNTFNYKIFGEKAKKYKFIIKRKKYIWNSPSIGKIYKKKIGKNSWSKKNLYKSKIKTDINDTLNLMKSQKNRKSKSNLIQNLKEKKIFNINNGMLIDFIVSSDEKLFISVNYVILINKMKNLNSNKEKVTSFNKDSFKIVKTGNFYIINNILSIITNNPKTKKLLLPVKSSIKNKIKQNLKKIKKQKKDENYNKKKKRFFFDFLKINKLNIIIKMYIFNYFWKKINDINSKIKKNNNDKNKIIDSTNDKIIVKKVKLFKKKIPNNDKEIQKDKRINKKRIKEKIININDLIIRKNIKKYLNKWKENLESIEDEYKNNNKSEINLLKKYKEKLFSLFNSKIISLKLKLIAFSLNKGKI